VSKKLLAAVAVASSLLTIGALALATDTWNRSTWPSQGYIVHLKDSPQTAYQCEILATFMNGQRIMTTFQRQAGRYAGCYLYLSGEMQKDGSFAVYRRPLNPLSREEWAQSRGGSSERTIKAADLDGACRLDVGNTPKDERKTPACARLFELMDAIRHG
jgi:hypothetical protein